MITTEYIVAFSLALFSIGVYGILARRNLVFILLSIEIMLNAVAVIFIAASNIHGHSDGQIMYLLILTLAASEVAIGLGLLIHMYRRHHTLDVDKLSSMRG